MKNLIILGVERSGKSSLAEMLIARGGFSDVSMDYLADSITYGLPQVGLKDDSEIDNPTFLSFMQKMIDTFPYAKLPHVTIIEGIRISPRKAVEITKPDEYKIVVLGYPNRTATEVLKRIREKEQDNCWTKDENDEFILEWVDKWIERSKIYQKDCHELGLTFIDTSFDFENSLNDFANNICEFLA
ncbi:MAG: hypothetical protein LBL21_02415 [Rickettsiales bacterium]|jgi:adenylate kinase family enzyme|nr:hypothetical protein [Rickettsiales bacterium]